MNPALDRYLATGAALAARLPGSGLPWVRDWRERARRRLGELGLPTHRHEAWKYTSLAALEKQNFEPLASPGTVNDVAAWQLPGGAHRLVLVDGHFVPGLSDLGRLPPRSVVKSFADALAQVPYLLENVLGEGEEPDALAALNAALATDGVFIDLGDGVVVEQPIHVLYLSTAAGSMSTSRSLMLVGAGASATVVEEHLGLTAEAYFVNVRSEVRLAREARFEHLRLQREGTKAQHLGALRVRQAAGSQLISQAVAMGALVSRQDIATHFAEPDCQARLNGLYVLGGRQHADHYTTIEHASPRGTSRELYHGILDGHSRGVFTGRVLVAPHAVGTDAAQANHNLLLSREAEVDTRPQLEIYADDVKCSHGATVGQIDENMLFYLRSRGVGLDLARNLLLHGFAREVLEKIGVASVRERLEQLLIERLPEHENLEGIL
ncbi:MAG: Fe-S cluster assembly protein SufD [Betaproteobacteria bacterium]|nr:Fe-S cluster assembly protein SufD [Betaproteobacteria bacterium]